MPLDFSPAPAAAPAPITPVAPAAPPGPPLVPGNYGAPPAVPAPVPQYPNTPAPAPAPVGLGGPAAGSAPSAPAAAPAPAVAPPADPTALQLAQTRAELARAQATLAAQQQYVTLGQQAAAAQRQAAPATPPNPFGVPSFDMSLRQFIGEDAAGQLVELPGAPLGTLNAFRAYQAAMPMGINKLLTDPRGSLAPVIQEMVREEAAKIADARFADRDRQSQVNQIFAEIEPWAIAKGGDGKQVMVVNPQSGQLEPQFTPLGEAFSRAAHQMSQAGVTDPRLIHQYAMAHVEAVRARMPAAPAAAPVPTLAQNFGAYPQAPAHLAAPGQAAVPSMPPMIPNERPKMADFVRQQFARDGTYRPAA